jgi:hypothetical protein
MQCHGGIPSDGVGTGMGGRIGDPVTNVGWVRITG